MLNVRASFNRRIVELADSGVEVLTQPDQAWLDPCYRVAWLAGEFPRGVGHYARNVRLHVRGTMGEFDAEDRLLRLLEGLGLVGPISVATANLYDYRANPSAPALVGSFKIERSPRGVDVLTSEATPNLRHLVINLVVVYQR